MGKVVILGGNARSGKTTLAFKLVKKGYSRVSLDNLETYITNGLNIDFDSYTAETKLNFFKTIVENAYEESKNYDTNIVIDMYDYLPCDLEKIDGIDKSNVYFLIYPNSSKEEIKYGVVHYAKSTDWIAQVNENYLNECVDRFYERNKIVLEQCKQYGYKYVDTTIGETRNNILETLINEIHKKS